MSPPCHDPPWLSQIYCRKYTQTLRVFLHDAITPLISPPSDAWVGVPSAPKITHGTAITPPPYAITPASGICGSPKTVYRGWRWKLMKTTIGHLLLVARDKLWRSSITNIDTTPPHDMLGLGNSLLWKRPQQSTLGGQTLRCGWR